MEKRNLELYVHIPFCIQKCAYCDFLSEAATKEEMKAYVFALRREIEYHKAFQKDYVVTTIFIGGGTPSLLSPEQITAIMDSVYDNFEISDQPEITIEMNPGTFTKEKAKAYVQCGINRVSIGLQSAHNEELKLLGRVHTFEDFIRTYNGLRECGINNINVDLISAIPTQSYKSYLDSLRTVIALQPEHISAYSLIIEEGTPFYERYGEGKRQEELLDDDQEREIYYATQKILKEEAYEQYEVSNYCKKGYACDHNIGYWKRTEYLGLGLGAASLIDNVRFINESDREVYVRHAMEGQPVQKEKNQLSENEQMEETMFLGLRMLGGVSKKEFYQSFGKTIWQVYEDVLVSNKEKGFIRETDESIQLTNKGIDISNSVLADFLL